MDRVSCDALVVEHKTSASDRVLLQEHEEGVDDTEPGSLDIPSFAIDPAANLDISCERIKELYASVPTQNVTPIDVELIDAHEKRMNKVIHDMLITSFLYGQPRRSGQ